MQQQRQSTRGDFDPRPTASEHRSNQLSRSMYPRLQQEEREQILSQSLPLNQDFTSMRQMDMPRRPTNRSRENQQRKSMFASGERGNRYRFDPENGEQMYTSTRVMNRSESAPIKNASHNTVSGQHESEQHKLHQSMRMRMQDQSIDRKDGNIIQPSLREQLVQQQRMHQSMRIEGHEKSHQTLSRHNRMQQINIHQSMQIPRNKDQRRSWDRQKDQQSEGGFSRGDISDGAVAGSIAPMSMKNNTQIISLDQWRGNSDNRSLDFQFEEAVPQPQNRRNDLAKSMIINVNNDIKSMVNVAERRSFQDTKQNLASNVSRHYQPVSRNSSFREESDAHPLPQMNNSLRSSGRRTTELQHRLNNSFHSKREMNNSFGRRATTGQNRLNHSFHSSGERPDAFRNQIITHMHDQDRLSSSERSGRNQLLNSDRLSSSERSGGQRHASTLHQSMVPQRRRSWVKNDENKLRASMGNVLTQSDQAEMRGLGAMLYPGSGMKRELVPDDEDLSDEDLVIDESPIQEGLQKSFTSQADKSRGSATYRNSLSEREHRNSMRSSYKTSNSENQEEVPCDRFKSLRNFPKRNSSGWKTLSEDKSRINYRRAFIGLVCGGIVAGGIITAAIFLAPFNSNENNVDYSLEDNSTESSNLPLPEQDIEGRCSPSNIHGSMAACVEACTMAACCYPGYSGISCYDDANAASVEACTKYRPYCDAIFAPWKDALSGGVAPPPVDLFKQKQWDEVCFSSGVSSSVRLPSKRRYHAEQTNTKRTSKETITPHVCQQACLPGRCCSAPPASSSSDLYITSDKVVKNKTSGYHVETSCLNEKNLQRCTEYMNKCGIVPPNFDEEYKADAADNTPYPTTPTMTTSPNFPAYSTLSTESSVEAQNDDGLDRQDEGVRPQLKQTSNPSEVISSKPTIQPTRTAPSVPLPNIREIKNACTGTQAVIDIVEGVLDAVMACQRVCQPSACCFSDTEISSCFDANRETCMAYSDCLVLSMTTDDIAVIDTSKSDPPPNPTKDLTQFCSLSATSAGVFECVKACLPSSCCGAADQELSCFNKYEEECSLYAPCLLLSNAHDGDTKSIPPVPPASLSYICSYSSIDIDSIECTLACSAGMCCLDNSCPPYGDEESIKERCELYWPCNSLVDLDMPSGDFEQLCDNTSPIYDENGCSEGCSESLCCFSDSDDPCFARHQEACVAYAPYCLTSPSMDDTDVMLIMQLESAPPNLPELCKGASASLACQQACSAAACCFLPEENGNCWASNESICGEYSICAFLYQEFQENDDQFT